MNSESTARFGVWFKGRRESVGLKQAEFVRQKGIVGRTTINQIEKGKTTIKTETALALGRAVGATDLETIAATGMIVGLSVQAAQLAADIATLTDEDQRIVAGVVRVIRQERERGRG